MENLYSLILILFFVLHPLLKAGMQFLFHLKDTSLRKNNDVRIIILPNKLSKSEIKENEMKRTHEITVLKLANEHDLARGRLEHQQAIEMMLLHNSLQCQHFFSSH